MRGAGYTFAIAGLVVAALIFLGLFTGAASAIQEAVVVALTIMVIVGSYVLARLFVWAAERKEHVETIKALSYIQEGNAIRHKALMEELRKISGASEHIDPQDRDGDGTDSGSD